MKIIKKMREEKFVWWLTLIQLASVCADTLFFVLVEILIVNYCLLYHTLDTYGSLGIYPVHIGLVFFKVLRGGEKFIESTVGFHHCHLIVHLFDSLYFLNISNLGYVVFLNMTRFELLLFSVDRRIFAWRGWDPLVLIALPEFLDLVKLITRVLLLKLFHILILINF